MKHKIKANAYSRQVYGKVGRIEHLVPSPVLICRSGYADQATGEFGNIHLLWLSVGALANV